MGIQGLLPLLEGITRTVHISEYAGRKVAIDVYCWLHKGVYSCSYEICQGLPTDKYVSYCMKRLHLLLQNKVIPIVIFDGGPLPMKRSKEEERRQSRDEYRSKGVSYLKEGNTTAANECFQKAVDITPQMAFNLIKALRRENIEYIVAPYEADAQLAFLSLGSFVDCVITEDSDLLAYGCHKVLFKMDKDGTGKEIRLADVASLQKPSFINFTQQMLRQICILAGCDYLASIPGMGIKKAHGLMKKYRTLERVFAYLRSSKSFTLPSGYEEGFRKAELTFVHQRVFDPTKNSVVTLTPLPDSILAQVTDFLGPPIQDDVAVQIAVGNIDPQSRKPLSELVQSKDVLRGSDESVRQIDQPKAQDSSIIRTSGARPLQLPVQKNSITHYFNTSSSATKKPFVPPRSKSLSLSTSSDSNLNLSEERPPSPPAKKPKTDLEGSTERVIVPRSPSPPVRSQVIVSKYFVSATSKGLSRSLFKEKSESLSFYSPFVNSGSRLSLQSGICSREGSCDLLCLEETDSQPNDTEIIQSDDEVIKSDDESEF